MDIASGRGNLDVVKWLHVIRTEGCTDDALYSAAANGHFEMVKWLYANRPECRSENAIAEPFDMATYKLRTGSLQSSLNLMCTIGGPMWLGMKNQLESLLFLRAMYPSEFTPEVLRLQREDFFMYEWRLTAKMMLGWVDQNYPKQNN
ncbi:unnamed protein product [Phytophthora lilii]|uniref:Unnamed protein product n=1 Tax=Phytophthora lilii TaxID=2077276 RepID=A0A9W6TB68_9STRA|nr:unnamed protein product [Phytophthora lilii]